MNTTLLTTVIGLALGMVITPLAATAQSPDVQVPIPTTAKEVPGPVPGNAMTQSYVQMVGRLAYVWGYPMVNAYNRRKAFSEAPAPGLLGGMVPIAPVGYNAMLTNYIEPQERFIVCPNQDVVYGAGFTALDIEPTVVQVPDFGDRFYVYALYDARTDEIARIGKQYGTKPGFYLIAGENWKGAVPPGITAVARSSTDLVFVVPRVFKDDTEADTKAVQPLLNQIVMYPLSQFDGKMKVVDYSKLPHFPAPAGSGHGETKWVKPSTYYDDLSDVMTRVPPLPGEHALYGWIRSVWEAAAKDAATKQQLVEAFVAADAELVDPWFQFRYNGRSIGHGWTAPANASQWGTDYLNRTAIAKSSMYQNTPEETQYQFKEIGQPGSTARRHPSVHDHICQGAASTRERVLVVDALQRGPLFPSEFVATVLARDQEQDIAGESGRFADALPRLQVPWRGQGSQLAARTHRPVLVAVAQLLARSIDHRRPLGAARRREGAVIARH